MKNKKNIIIFLVLAVILITPVVVVASSHGYNLLEPLPGLGKTTNVTLSDYLGWLFPFMLTTAAILAVLMIVIGGIKLIWGGSEKLQTEAREQIKMAVLGLLLAISSWLILNTINPDLVNFNLNIPAITI